MRNPLDKRIWRSLKAEAGKYLVIFLMLVRSIGFVSGFLVADGSMIIAYEESFEKYQIEDGNFRTAKRVSEEESEEIEALGILLYENFYVEEESLNGSTLRIFQERSGIDEVCLMQGKMPDSDDEIAIDRMYAQNNQISVGENFKVGDREVQVTGLVALSDYSALFSDNNDSMFDAVKFGVAIMTQDGMADFGSVHLHYSYSWHYKEEPESEKQEKEMAEKLMKELNAIIELEDFVPRYLNQSIRFTGEDMGGDRSMIITLLYMIIVILAFVFGITISNTIRKEATVIGTLRASGYTKAELIRHYMTMPILVTLAGALMGNLLGYTVFKNLCAAMYYGSYSLPTYETIWNAEAFVMTTVVPVVLMFLINLVILAHKLSLEPLKFLRRDLKKGRQKSVLRLNERLPFFQRFRMRIILQNISNYVTLFVGIVFANLLLMFGLLLPSVLDHFQEEIVENMLCEYQYILKVPQVQETDGAMEKMVQMLFLSGMETANEDAEPFAVCSLNTIEGKYKSEKISVYGVEKENAYVSLDFSEPGVYVTEGYAEKFGVRVGETITLKERYEEKTYEFEVAGTYNYPGALAIFMSREAFQKLFGYEKYYYNGYFSDSQITDLAELYIASVIDREDLTKLSRQLDVSMGSMMTMIDAFAVVMFLILLYLLSKMIIEKNAQSISMVKILGYQNREISRLYILSTTIMTGVFLLLSFPIEAYAMRWLFLNVMMTSIAGWIPLSIAPEIYVKMFLLGAVTYMVVAMMEYKKIQGVPLEEALKHVE